MDFRHMILADGLTIGLAVAGLCVAAGWSQVPFFGHALGALIGPTGLYVINLVYRHLRGRDGLGLGDVKLMAGAGAWLGWQGLPSMLLYSTMAALIAVFCGLAGRNLARDTAVPFGAFICLGMWIVWLAGPIQFVPWQ
jgi:leader peptidase (prepilin peptidase) / N-methyltransferase